jgi:hypothetical protein
MEKFDKLETEIRIQGRRKQSWQETMLEQSSVELLSHSGLSEEPLVSFSLQTRLALCKRFEVLLVLSQEFVDEYANFLFRRFFLSGARCANVGSISRYRCYLFVLTGQFVFVGLSRDGYVIESQLPECGIESGPDYSSNFFGQGCLNG